jgi:MtrB/PioB family decaheme-associated outer membrane protein
MTTKTANRRKDIFGRTIMYLAVASALLPTAALAQEDAEAFRELTQTASEVNIGLGNVSRDSFAAGDYTGLKNKGAYVIGDIDLVGRDPKSANAWRITGSNLGLGSRNLRTEYGQQGNYRFTFEYDQLPKYRTESAKTIFNGVGGNNLTLPSTWVGASSTTGFTQLNTSLRTIDVSHERKNHIFGFSKILSNEWDTSVKFRHETKEGSKIVGAVIGNSGGNPRSVLIPEPIDYKTNEFEAKVGYTTAKLQFQAGYLLSMFDNSNSSLIWQNPYTAIGGWSAAAGFPTGQGQLGLPPDNRFHQITASLGYNITDKTRFTGTLALGRMTQDQAFLPYTINPGLTVTTPLPRSSLDGKIDTTLINLALTARPMPKLNLRASLRYDDRDNKTPRSEYIYIGGDSTNQATTPSDRWRTNLPISYKQNLLKLDGDYQIAARTKLNVGYDYEEIKRTFTQVDETTENTYHIGLRRSFSEMLSGGVSYARSDRRNKGYTDAPFDESYNATYIAGLPAGTRWDDHPLLRKFMYADRERDKFRLSLNASPHEMVSLQFRADYNQDDYRNTVLGLTETRSESYTVDASVTPKQNLTLYSFYTYDNYKSNQRGRQFTSATKLAQSTPLTSTSDWFNASDDRIDTFGLGFKAKELMGGRFELGGDYTYSHATGEINTTTGSALPAAAPIPNLVSRFQTLQIYGTYKLQKNATLRLSLLHRKLRSDDWAWDNVNPNTMANVLSTGQLSPNYSVNVIGVSVSYKYW